MRARTVKIAVCLLLSSQAQPATVIGSSAMIQIPTGRYESFVPEREFPGAPLKSPTIDISAFDLDRHPVTNAQFLQFVQHNKSWQKDRISRLFADENYLQHWQSPLRPGPKVALDSPVVYVSWFAAHAYCKALDKRLASTYEWEYVAGPDFYGDSRQDRDLLLQQILEWYGQPVQPLLKTGRNLITHKLGMRDLHGLIWEWTADFNSVIASEESRETASLDSDMFCGAGAIGGRDPSDYAAYMRFALRSSLKGGFCLASLGFRCALDRAP